MDGHKDILRDLRSRLWDKELENGKNYLERTNKVTGRTYWYLAVRSLKEGCPVLVVIEEGGMQCTEFYFRNPGDLSQLDGVSVLTQEMTEFIRKACSEYFECL